MNGVGDPAVEIDLILLGQDAAVRVPGFWRRNCNRREIAEGIRRATVIVGELYGDFGATPAKEM
ncbi:MAG TPA: hypothetical protein VJ860_09470 [Polyangia bacterium]|nr:hypothetical protein [Polyangia bacterium]